MTIDYQFDAHFEAKLASIRRESRAHAQRILWSIAEPKPLEQPSAFLERAVTLKTDFTKSQPGGKAAFSFAGHEFWREIVDAIAEDDWMELTWCAYTGAGKTTVTGLGHLLWRIEFDPIAGVVVFPAQQPGPGTAQYFVKSRFKSTLEATPIFADRLPVGGDRFDISNKAVRMAGSEIHFVGGKSPRAVSDARANLMVLQEQDKFDENLRADRESGTDEQAMSRLTGGDGNGKLTRSSTPTHEEKGIWPHLQRSDFRLRFLPCPHCNGKAKTQKLKNSDSAISDFRLEGWFIFVKEKNFTVLPQKFREEITIQVGSSRCDDRTAQRAVPTITIPAGTPIPMAELKWDAAAKGRDGEWDMARVIKTAHFECPHCKGKILDAHRSWMDLQGVWIPTQRAIRHRGYHISAYYGPHLAGGTDLETSFGGFAKKFLEANATGKMRAHINLDLAEVHVSQESADRSIVEMANDTPRATSQHWIPILSVDNQQNFPYRWFIVRNFLAAVLRPVRNEEQQAAFEEKFSSEHRSLASKMTADDADGIYSAAKILFHLQRTDHWPALAGWLIGNGITGKKLTEFFQVEFQTDLLRLIEFICKQKEVNIPLGKQGDSELLEAGFCDLWEELDEIQARNKVTNINVLVDAAWGTGEVSAECFRRCPKKLPNGASGFCFYHPFLKKYIETTDEKKWNFARFGWTPVFGFEKSKTWKDYRGISFPYTTRNEDMIDDPFKGQSNSNTFHHHVFKFSAQWALSEMARIRKRNAFTLAAGCRWTPNEREHRGGVMSREEYQRHLRGYFWDEKKMIWDAPAKHSGAASKRNPNHLFDCEKNAIAWAASKGIFRYEKSENNVANKGEN